MRDAGRYAEWAVAFQRGVRSGEGIEVPCGTCVACCTSGQTIVVEDHEAARLPADAVVVLPDGDRALARDDTGRCALLVDGSCTVYDRRPGRCRTYDCRIFPATGLAPEADKPAIAEQAARWRFALDSPEDGARLRATRLALLTIVSGQLGGRSTSTTQLAAAAVLAHDELLDG